MKPMYIEDKDRKGKKAAREAFKTFVGQNPATHGYTFTVTPGEIYEMVPRV